MNLENQTKESELLFQEDKEKVKERGQEFAFRFTFSRLSNNQKKAFKEKLNTTILWATSGVD
jgi:hypothetical protein